MLLFNILLQLNQEKKEEIPVELMSKTSLHIPVLLEHVLNILCRNEKQVRFKEDKEKAQRKKNE